jgi:hypothetical protein
LRAGCLFLLTALAVRPGSLDPLECLPSNYQLAFENEWVRVVHVRYGPREKLPVHNHSGRATVYVYLTDSGPVRFSHIENPPFTLIRPPLKAGSFRVSPGRIETHEVENLGDVPSEFLRVELKQIPLGQAKLFARGPAPADLSSSGLTKQYVRPQLVIERIVAASGKAVELDDPAIPSLVVAFSDARLPAKSLHRGEVYWLAPGKTQAVENAGAAVAHLLRIEFPTTLTAKT